MVDNDSDASWSVINEVCNKINLVGCGVSPLPVCRRQLRSESHVSICPDSTAWSDKDVVDEGVVTLQLLLCS